MPMIIHILGKGDGWEEIKNVPSGSIIYGCNDAFLRTPEVTHTFHMHDLDKFLKDEKTASSTRLCILRANKNPGMEFYSIKEFDSIPHLKEYPLDEIIEHFKLPVAYFTSGPDYMIAYAVYAGATELNYYGLNMSVHEEWYYQKPGVEFWTGIAMGRGITVNIQYENTSLFKTRNSEIYGYNIRQWRTNV